MEAVPQPKCQSRIAMKTLTQQARNGLIFTCPTPETTEEFDGLAGRVGASLVSACDLIWHYGVIPEIWYWLAVRLAQESGIERRMKKHPEGKTYQEVGRKGQVIQVPAESDAQYVDRVAAEQGVAPTSYQPIVDEICKMVGPVNAIYGTDVELIHGERLIDFDPSRLGSERRRNEPDPKDLEDAKGLVDQTKNNLKVSLAKIEYLTGTVVELVDESDPDHAGKNLQIVAVALKKYKKACRLACRRSP